eukprot:TRINITY_DN671_c2_g1_i4.p1 TRINITY_DN671_c2_g1~~TRINITY_DN671_c2_g1_i4.p1  ORF type:complete len:2510 (-),score=661.45 TRINITY_DN671_c2_g1_i4:15-7070(-)
MDTYVGYRVGKLSPHVFAIAEEAFRSLQTQNASQSILVSGESGAGKTETTKYVLRYLAAMSSEAGTTTQTTTLALKVLKSTPILEAFGNARTRFNNNSSRFGKFIEIWFSRDRYAICGSALRTYLLEKSRVVKPAKKERNFHVFYQLLSSTDTGLKSRIGLTDAEPTDFYYINQSGTYTVDNVDDEETFGQTLAAMEVVGISRQEQEDMFRVLAAILFIGNVAFKETGREEAFIVEDETDSELLKNGSKSKALNTAASILGFSAKVIERSFLSRTIVVGGENLVKPLDKEKAENTRDSLAMLLYSNLFDWLVARINTSLKEDSQAAVKKRNPTRAVPEDNLLIGILDIYGFECFDTNGFPQFCINYANEKLQNHFIHFIFKREQQEYIKQKIDWSYIEFKDNEGCIDLLENKKLSILALLEEECRFPKGTDLSFAEKVRKEHKRDPFFAEPRFSRSAFSVKHFAGLVDYEATTGFLDKNRDYSVPAQVDALKSSTNRFLVQLFNKQEAQVPESTDTKKKVMSIFQKDTGTSFRFVGVISQFRESLSRLMVTIQSTQPHFVRCIKPNAKQVPDRFDKPLVLAQLRSGGVMEAVRVTSAGYPSRTNYRKFYDRYKILAQHLKNTDDDRDSCKNLLDALDIKDTESGRNVIQLGTTKIFMKAGVIANLEKMRVDRLNACAAVFQKHWKRKMQYRLYMAQRAAAAKLQSYGRMYLAKQQLYQLKKEKATLIIQTALRRNVERKRFKELRNAAVTVQWIFRGVSLEHKRLEAERLAKEKRDKALLIIKQALHVHLVNNRRKKLLRAATLAQALWKGKRARRKYAVLVREWRAEQKRKRQEAKRLKKEEEERQRKELEEKLRQEKKERKRIKKEALAREEAARQEAERLVREAEEKRRHEEEQRIKDEAEQARLAQEEAKRKRHEEKVRKREQDELEAKRKREEEERKRQEEDALREKLREEKRVRKEEEEAARRKKEEEEAKARQLSEEKRLKEKAERRAQKLAEAEHKAQENEEQRKKDTELRVGLEELIEQLRRELKIRDDKIVALIDTNQKQLEEHKQATEAWKQSEKDLRKEIKKRDKIIESLEADKARLNEENEAAKRENKEKKEALRLEQNQKKDVEMIAESLRRDLQQEASKAQDLEKALQSAKEDIDSAKQVTRAKKDQLSSETQRRVELEQVVASLKEQMQSEAEKVKGFTATLSEIEAKEADRKRKLQEENEVERKRKELEKQKKKQKLETLRKQLEQKDSELKSKGDKILESLSEKEKVERAIEELREALLLEKQKREFLEQTNQQLKNEAEQDRKKREEKKAKEREELKQVERERKSKKREQQTLIEKLEKELETRNEELKAEREAKLGVQSAKKMAEISMEKDRLFLEGVISEQASSHEAEMSRQAAEWEAKRAKLEEEAEEAHRRDLAQIEALRRELNNAFGKGEQSESERKRAEEEIERSRLQYDADSKAEAERLSKVKGELEHARAEVERLTEKRKRSDDEHKRAIEQIRAELDIERSSKADIHRGLGDKVVDLEKLQERYKALDTQNSALIAAKKKKSAKLKKDLEQQQLVYSEQVQDMQSQLDDLAAERKKIEDEAERRVVALTHRMEDIFGRLQIRKEEQEAERQLWDEEAKEAQTSYRKRLSELQDQHDEQVRNLAKQMSEKTAQMDQMKGKWDIEWKGLNKLKDAEIRQLEDTCSEVTSDLQAEKERRKLVERDLRETRRKNRIQISKLQRAKERERREMVSRMSRDEADVEMLTTMLGGSSEEGKKMLIGYVIAEERGFSNAIPVPSLVIYRFLRYWDEISYKVVLPNTNNKMSIYGFAMNSQNISFLLSYTISSFKALFHMASSDTSLLAFCLSNFSFLLHALLKDRAYEEDEELAEGEVEVEDGEFSSDEEESDGGAHRPPKGSVRTVRIPRFDSLDSIKLFMLQEGVEEKQVEMDLSPMKQRRQTMYGAGSPLALAQTSPSVVWFESQIKVLLGSCYAQMLSNICNSDLKKSVEIAVFSHKKRDSDAFDPEMERVLNILNDYMLEFQSNFIHFGLSNQFFQQVFRFIDSVLFNVLLLRKDLCNYRSGEEIQHKLLRLESWAKDIGQEWVGRSFECLQHVRQAAKVLVMNQRQRKQLCVDTSYRQQECPNLNVTQLKQILSLYTPSQGEDKFPLDLIAKLVATQTGEKEPLVVDATQATSLVVTELHYVTLEDVMTLPFPMSVKRHFEQEQRANRVGRPRSHTGGDGDGTRGDEDGISALEGSRGGGSGGVGSLPLRDRRERTGSERGQPPGEAHSPRRGERSGISGDYRSERERGDRETSPPSNSNSNSSKQTDPRLPKPKLSGSKPVGGSLSRATGRQGSQAPSRSGRMW